MDSLKNTFQKWTPLGHLAGTYDVDEISWSTEGISFSLVSDSKPVTQSNVKKFKLTWDSSHMISYHVTDETYRADCWGLDFEHDGRFYISRESEYIQRFRQKSPLFPDTVTHFVMIGTNTIVDVLAKECPTVKIEA